MLRASLSTTARINPAMLRRGAATSVDPLQAVALKHLQKYKKIVDEMVAKKKAQPGLLSQRPEFVAELAKRGIKQLTEADMESKKKLTAEEMQRHLFGGETFAELKQQAVAQSAAEAAAADAAAKK